MQRVVALDLDGTLLTSRKLPCPRAWMRLSEMGASTIRVIATGRNVHAAEKVIPKGPESPIDYVVAGSGGITIHWPTQRVVDRRTLASITAPVANALMQANIPFFLLHAPPHNHHCFAFVPEDRNAIRGINDGLREFQRRIDDIHPATTTVVNQRQLAEIMDHNNLDYGQFLLMGLEDSNAVKSLVVDAAPTDAVRFVEVTSDTGVQWLEILPRDVSKALAVEAIAKLHDIAVDNCLAVGNDWNDLDMLAWAGSGYVVSNAPDAFKLHLKSNCPRVSILPVSNDQEGVFFALANLDEDTRE